MSQEPEPEPGQQRDRVDPADLDIPSGATAWLLTITAEAEVIPGEPKQSEE